MFFFFGAGGGGAGGGGAGAGGAGGGGGGAGAGGGGAGGKDGSGPPLLGSGSGPDGVYVTFVGVLFSFIYNPANIVLFLINGLPSLFK